MSKLAKCGYEPMPDEYVERIKTKMADGIATGMIEFQYAAIDRKRRLTVIVTKDGGRWHLSIAHPGRYPIWDEIKEAREIFLPDEVYMMMPLPPKAVWVNLHNNCFHLWEAQELKTIWAMDQM